MSPRRAAPLCLLLLLSLRAAAAPPAAALLKQAEEEDERGHYEKALGLARQAVARSEAPGATPRDELVPALCRVGALLIKLSQYDRAREVLERADGLAAASRRPRFVALVDEALGELHFMKAAYTEAERRYKEALAIEEREHGPDGLPVATALQGLATLSWRWRRFEEAEALLLRSLKIRQRHLGEDHPEVATTLNGLALVYRLRGDLPRAFELYERALKIRERRLGPDHPEVASSLGNLGDYYVQIQDYARAESLYERALRIREAALGPASHGTGGSLNSLAHLYNARGDYARAEPLFRRAIAIYESTVGPKHSSTGTLVNNLAELLRNRGDLPAAEVEARRAVRIRRGSLGSDHTNVADSLHGLALILGRRGQLAEAVPLFTEAFDIYERHLRREGPGLSDKSLGAFLQMLRAREEAIYALLERNPGDEQVRRLALAATLSRKGRSVEETARTFQLIRKNLGSPEDKERLGRLRALRQQQASTELASLDRATADKLAREIEQLEEELAQRSRALRALRVQPAPSELPGRVARALPKDAALVEYVAYQTEPPRSISLVQPVARRSYLALVLLPDGRTAAAPLGSADVVEPAVRALLEALSRPPRPGEEGREVQSAQALYRLVLSPLRAQLQDRRRLYLSTEGQLHLVPFAALHDGADYLLSRHALSYLSGGQALLRGAEAAGPASEVVIFADPDFSGLPRAYAPLGGTRREASAIRRLAPAARVYLGADASKENLLKVRSPAILHIATHGVYLGDEAAAGSAGDRGMKVAKDAAPAAPPPMKSLRQAPDLSPLVRSMLILSAGAASPSGAPGESGEGRGALTALEVAGMDLSGTQLIVLSACDTGKGELRVGQGVYGLRRAFLLAGAETVVTSLWRVSDEGTEELMGSYYRHLLGGGGRAQAMHEAALEVRRRRPHPYFWAPFIVTGDERPLRGCGPAGRGTGGPPSGPCPR